MSSKAIKKEIRELIGQSTAEYRSHLANRIIEQDIPVADLIDILLERECLKLLEILG